MQYMLLVNFYYSDAGGPATATAVYGWGWLRMVGYIGQRCRGWRWGWPFNSREIKYSWHVKRKCWIKWFHLVLGETNLPTDTDNNSQYCKLSSCTTSQCILPQTHRNLPDAVVDKSPCRSLADIYDYAFMFLTRSREIVNKLHPVGFMILQVCHPQPRA